MVDQAVLREVRVDHFPDVRLVDQVGLGFRVFLLRVLVVGHINNI